MGESVPRRMRRFYRKKEEGKEQPGKGTGFEGIPSEDSIEQELLEKKGKTSNKMLEDIESSLKEIEKSESEGLGNRRERTRGLVLGEVKRFRERHDRLPMRSEYDSIVENIFSLMQEEDAKDRQKTAMQREKEREKSRLERREMRKTRSTGKEEEIPVEEPKPSIGIEGLKVEDVFGEKNKKKEKQEFTLEEEKEGETELNLSELEEEEQETGKCKNCGREGTMQAYCPECGQQFCEKCAKTTRKIAGKTEMLCPVCGAKTRK